MRGTLRAVGLVIGIVVAVSAAGCGGGGGRGGTATPLAGLNASLYMGHWTGTWESESGARGTLDVTVDSEGRSTGWVIEEGKGLSGRTSGRIAGDGQISETWRFPEGAAIRVLGPSRLEGRDELLATLGATQDYVDVPPVRVKLLRHYH